MQENNYVTSNTQARYMITAAKWLIIIKRQFVKRHNMAWVTTRAPNNVRSLCVVWEFKQICLQATLKCSDSFGWPDVDQQAVPWFFENASNWLQLTMLHTNRVNSKWHASFRMARISSLSPSKAASSIRFCRLTISRYLLRSSSSFFRAFSISCWCILTIFAYA